MKAALLVIDMQNDYLYDKRKKIFSYDTKQFTAAVNEVIHSYDAQDVIYIRHMIQNLPTNKLLFGYSIKGTVGAELYGGLDVVSDNHFDKYFGDALTNKKLRAFIDKNGYDTLHLCGLDEYGCVASTALGAHKRGINAKIVRNGTATVFPEKKSKAKRELLKKAEIEYI